MPNQAIQNERLAMKLPFQGWFLEVAELPEL
jgi:hypothetical protein